MNNSEGLTVRRAQNPSASLDELARILGRGEN
ncbi:hypothetical protein CBM2615_A10052 [Cupriavidus taiwanensis]|uniref:Uncharacterized protein n=1 Tax=Cupriavidus taiwanensis TaxID=164546 RepID=A0A375DV55_9BURK|nr:hypothetical protein CBM2614_A10054 [Cupriavidus taiwanensis]SOZ48789.1 hypothetical protein CBM2615_A10052 [Cupriavidus taiwanensis]SOZ51617.1 hypothetical protein CBM2613_A10053 [Cupriavidus taiwanensis]SPA03993.1 hypothetical protein CBM2625_A10052 [Cupriavidus taiwanensis]